MKKENLPDFYQELDRRLKRKGGGVTVEELREVFYKTMAEMMDENPQVVYLDADLPEPWEQPDCFRSFHSRPLIWGSWKPI